MLEPDVMLLIANLTLTMSNEEAKSTRAGRSAAPAPLNLQV